MRVSIIPAAMVLLAGCSVERQSNSVTEADINAAAADAQGDIDTYAANTLQPAVPQPPTPAATPSQTAVAATPVAPDSAQDAADVVQTYYALLEAKNYGRAWRLWEDGGRASGLTAAQFADSFAKYDDYNAEVGAPGRVDAGAGQRYVEVPVRVSGRLADGGAPFNMAGSLTLHRTADIDGATPEQRSWRIKDSSIRPRPDTDTAAVPATAEAVYRCAGKTRVSVRFDNDADTATVRRDGHDLAVLDGQRPASGIWYKGGGYELRGKGRDADYTAPGRPSVACTVD